MARICYQTIAHIVTAGEDGLVRVFDLATGAVLREFTPSERHVEDMAISLDEHYLVTVSKEPGLTASRWVTIWDLQTGEHLHTLDHFANPICLDITLNSRYLLVVRYGSAPVRDLATGDVILVFSSASGVRRCGEISPDGQLVVTAQNKYVLLWDISDLYQDQHPPQ